MGSPRVLVVSGNRGMARSVSAALRGKGYEAPVAVDGPTAMAMADAMTPALIVLDLTSPGLADSSIISEIRRVRDLERTPIAVLTTRVDMPDRRVQASVLVPIDAAELLSAVVGILGEPDPANASASGEASQSQPGSLSAPGGASKPVL
jgi:DNA-binding response OmpR family regulator